MFIQILLVVFENIIQQIFKEMILKLFLFCTLTVVLFMGVGRARESLGYALLPLTFQKKSKYKRRKYTKD
jgi:hypothetical protein